MAIDVTFTPSQIIEAWLNARCDEYRPEQIRLRHEILQSLAAGKPVAAGQAAATTGRSLAEIQQEFARLKACGAEYDAGGNITGLVLSLNPTLHSFHVNGHHLYAWCALDTLFLPGLIGQTAQVASVCRVTGDRIRLTVTPTGVAFVEPAGTMLSIVVPGVSAACAPAPRAVGQRPACEAMHFFRSRPVAKQWLAAHPDIAILTADEAWQLAYTVWIAPAAKISAKER
jgi:alkylmercury lyase